ncbi:50S ribosome-binding GTPase family protein [Escherichia coli 3-073-06_S3_C1]|nr:50S ribosome-binding GTPase family protein [Escherichia coli 2-011-08_S3_C2]KDW72021.1 50S ribosome-binding GTPase family protein [Escherichia coli 2-005-03_S4_C1]KDY92661.1 50S ribosome-binding GTPase family protein [Escherichia coli 2-474-04_S3_C1]KDY96429.1 50S ribosome-binding GTPase family protein [Escherichia coli 2-474-04_S3_C2]KDZ16681.1 50S ribosome-binding GTPase family protein [Escherichia coli 2-474-04_S3_C3]KDZ65689.1 50S ribosome-binding GTPase family protein [Escherichia coli
MKRIAFVGSVGAGKTTLFNALQGNYTLARKTQAWNLMIRAILIRRVNILTIPAGITP